MRKQERLDEPAALQHEATTWTEGWVRQQAEGKAWRWPVRDKQPLNQILLPTLRKQTSSHCSFCDGFPVASLSIETIEHFFPKSSFPERAFDWRNLFYSCTRCQAAKKERFDPKILKPDESDYDFSRYFICDYTTGRIEPNPSATLEDQQRAETTIHHYKLNDAFLPDERRRWLQIWSRMDPNTELDDFAYRDFLA